jgi:arogenate dehydrogenase (NADP+)
MKACFDSTGMMQIGIIGLGLIGGSLGFDLRAKGHRVLGVSRNTETCRIAMEKGAVDQAASEFSLLQGTDVVFLCTPLGVMQATTQALIPHLSPRTVLTDVGSVKQSVVTQLEPLWPRFVGGHPMAGTEFTGILAAVSHLFRDRPYVLTPTPRTDPEAKTLLISLIQDLNSTYYECTPDQHDRAVALISHLPVMVSASLLQTCLREPNLDILQLAQSLASSGFRDTSRVGGGNPELGRMMAEHNQAEVLRSLQTYRQVLDQMIHLITQQQWDALEQCLQQNQIARSKFVE